uniref:Uncharacterized protein TCIL3000_2_560 n=1 Tax=Trypanosoma congolense (strain IL3000) TaxID=1068625 RepID=G0UJD1_TRYCI|nr:unnamed protein product [Trypanosoma congolense IL3000]
MPRVSGGDETMATTEGMIVNEINSVNIPSATVEIPERHQGPEGSDAQANTCAEASGAVENVHGDDVTANSPGEGFCETTAEQREGATVSGRILQTTDEEGRANAESTDYEPGSNNSLQVVPKATDNSSLSLPRGETTASPPTVGRVKPLVNPSPGARQPHVTPHTVASGLSNKSSEMKDPKLGEMTPAHRLEAVGNKDEHATSLGLRPTTHTNQVVPTHQFNRRGIYGSGGSDNSQYVLGEVRNGCNLTPAEEYNCFRIRNRVSANYKGPIHVVEEIHVSCAYCGCPVDTVTRVQAGGLSYHPQCIACKLCGTNSLTEAYFQITDKSAVCSECGARGLAGQVFCEEAMERGRYARAFRQKINGLIERYDLRDHRRTPHARREDGVIPPTLVLNTNREYGKNSNTRRSQLIQRQLYYSQNDNNIICLLESPSPQRSPGRSQRLPSLR